MSSVVCPSRETGKRELKLTLCVQSKLVQHRVVEGHSNSLDSHQNLASVLLHVGMAATEPSQCRLAEEGGEEGELGSD